jgi:hypothetical protein
VRGLCKEGKKRHNATYDNFTAVKILHGLPNVSLHSLNCSFMRSPYDDRGIRIVPP